MKRITPMRVTVLTAVAVVLLSSVVTLRSQAAADKTAPTIASVSVSPASVASGTSTTLAASASDNVGVTKVEFYVNGALKATDTTAPYSAVYATTGLTAGTYSVTAKAYDAAANTKVSNAVFLTVTPPPDTTAPTVGVTATPASATIGANITATATASDNVGVTKVEFYVDNVLKATNTTAPYTYSWATTGYAAGSHSVTAKAYDAAGNSKVSTAATVTLAAPDTTPPTISGSVYPGSVVAGGSIGLYTTASDNVGITKVEFYINGTYIGTDSDSPYTYGWVTTGYAPGSYTYTAKAYDAAGNVGTSTGVTMTVLADTVAPTISSTASATDLAAGGTVNLTSTASDNIGVTKVEYYVNGALKNTVATPPYSYAWSTTGVAPNSYYITAKAYDAAGNITTSNTLQVNVTTPVGPAPTTADGFTQLFAEKNDMTWSGGDQNTSYLAPNGKIYWLTGDTMTSNGTRADGAYPDNGTVMINNRILMQQGNQFSNAVTGSGVAIPPPATSNSTNQQRYWPQAEIMVGNTMYVFVQRVEVDPNNAGWFILKGSDIATFSVDATSGMLTYTGLSPTPSSGVDGGIAGPMNIQWAGDAIIKDGYAYVYGYTQAANNPYVAQYSYVARVPVASITTPSTWEYYKKSTDQWVNSTTLLSTDPAAPDSILPTQVSSVRIINNKIVVAHKPWQGMGTAVYIETSSNPQGPFVQTKVFDSPAGTWNGKNYITYGPMLHPEQTLSGTDSGKLLMNIDWNGADFWQDVLGNADLYKPRFYAVPMPQ